MKKEFFKVFDPSDELFPTLSEWLKTALVPIYGDQNIDRQIEKIKCGTDRRCEIYYLDGAPQGVIVYKNFLSNEYADLGIKNGFEEKITLPVPQRGSSMRFSDRKVIMNRLLERAVENAISMKAECFFGTVSSQKQGTLNLLLRYGFEVVQTLKDKFDFEEYLVVHRNVYEFLRSIQQFS